MTKQTFIQKNNGDTLNATEWNELTSYVNEAVDAINAGGNGGGNTPIAIDTNGVVSVNSKGNTTISSTKNVNIEPTYDTTGATNGTYGDVQIKPGDDITLESHHRATNKRDEITVKTSNGQNGDAKAPVKLQVIAADMTLSTKGKQVDDGSNDSPNVMNVNVTTGEGKGYLKVRAQAIDLRCEQHGGIALQPKGADGQGNENKIKFEHGGGDGLEFGTFNTEKTSIFTDEYRFNKDGVWKMATRNKLDNSVGAGGNGKSDPNDYTTHFSYQKQADDFYDIINDADATTTTKDIIMTSDALNGIGTKTHITNKGNLEIQSTERYLAIGESESVDKTFEGTHEVSSLEPFVTADGFNLSRSEFIAAFPAADSANIGTILDSVSNGETFEITLSYLSNPLVLHVKKIARGINIESCSKLSLKGILDFGSSFNFGETDDGVQFIKKYTKKGATKDCDTLVLTAVNNHATDSFTVQNVPSIGNNVSTGDPYYMEDSITVLPGTEERLCEVSILDICRLVTYMKATEQGPWLNNNL